MDNHTPHSLRLDWQKTFLQTIQQQPICLRLQQAAQNETLADWTTHLTTAVVGLIQINGETLIVVGSRDESVHFPYGYLKWWRLEKQSRRFRVV